MTIFRILQDVLPKGCNDNHNIFQMKITIFYNFMILPFKKSFLTY